MVDSSNNEYDFILNPQKQPRPPLVDLSGTSMIKKILIFSVGIIFLFILIASGLSFLNKSSNAQGQKLLGIVQAQAEIVRVATAAQEKITSKELLYRTINVQYSVSSSQQQLTGTLSGRGMKIDAKKLAQGQNPQNDATLLEGEQNAKFDETYEALLTQQLQNYYLQLKDAYNSSSAKEKAILDIAFDQLTILSSSSQTKQ